MVMAADEQTHSETASFTDILRLTQLRGLCEDGRRRIKKPHQTNHKARVSWANNTVTSSCPVPKPRYGHIQPGICKGIWYFP